MQQQDFDPTDIAAQEEAQRQKVEVERLLQQREVEDMLWLLNDRRGRRFFWRLLERTHVFKTSFAPDNRMAFLEGERNVGLQYFGMMQGHAPQRFAQMVKERREENGRNASST